MAFEDFVSLSCDGLCLIPLIGLLLTFIISYDYLKKRGLPPGPPSFPVIGNYLSPPKSKPWLLFTSWSKIYGGIYTLYTGPTPEIIISDPQVAFELSTSRSNKYSCRLRMIVFDMFSKSSFLIGYQSGPAWSLRRKVFHRFLKPSAIQTYKERQKAEASRLVYQISRDEGKRWKQTIDRFVSSTMFSLAYGRRIDSLPSKVLKKKSDFFGYANGLLVPGRYLVESLPFLNYLPPLIARWKIPVLEMGKRDAEFDSSLVNIVREDLKKSNGRTEGEGSLAENMLLGAQAGDEDLQTLLMNERHFSGVLATIFGTGSTTTIISLSGAVLAMILHPRVFIVAQKEIDEVVGIFRSPTFDDREKLPYLEALVKETLRWIPVLPMGIRHSTSEDDVYEGCSIPKGTTVMFNTWGMHQHPSYFPSADEFAPERFLSNSDERFRQELKGEKTFPGKHGHSGFGWGRRICAGADLAVNNMWIALAKLVWRFDLMPVEGERYEDLRIEGYNVLGVKDFGCKWKVRSEEYRKIMEIEWKAAEEVLNRFPAFA